MCHRGLHSVTATASSRLVLFAGAPKSGPMLGDLWGFDPASGAWEELDPDGQVRHVLEILPLLCRAACGQATCAQSLRTWALMGALASLCAACNICKHLHASGSLRMGQVAPR